MTLVTYPLDNTDYSAEDAALFHCTRTTGIYADDDFKFFVSGADNEITLGVGIVWMRMSRFKGVVAALKTEMVVDLGLPDPIYPRIDHVVIQYDANKNITEVVVKKGDAASAPRPPARSTSEALYEVHLMQVRREPGATAVTAKDVTDLRLDANYCGIMAESVTKVDTKAINAQAMALIDSLRDEISAVKGGAAFVMKSGDKMSGDLDMDGHSIIGAANFKQIAVSLPASGWAGNTQTVAAAGVTATAGVIVAPDPSSDNNYTAYSESGVRCTGQAEGQLIFKCDSTPSANLSVNVTIFV